VGLKGSIRSSIQGLSAEIIEMRSAPTIFRIESATSLIRHFFLNVSWSALFGPPRAHLITVLAGATGGHVGLRRPTRHGAWMKPPVLTVVSQLHCLTSIV
jgi:hypothetical protein